MSGLHRFQGIDSPSECVDLLVGIADNDLGRVLAHEYVEHGRIHILTFVDHENVVSEVLVLQVRLPQLPRFQVAIVRHPVKKKESSNFFNRKIFNSQILLDFLIGWIVHGAPNRNSVFQNHLAILGLNGGFVHQIGRPD